MDVHLSAINGLKNKYIVYNFQMRKISVVEKRTIKFIIELRRAQKNQDKRKKMKNSNWEDQNNKNIVNGGFLTPLIMTQIEVKKEDKKDEKKKKK